MKWLIPLSRSITIWNYMVAGETPSELVKASPHQREAPRQHRENHTRLWGRSCPSPPCCSHKQAVLLSWKPKKQEYFPFLPSSFAKTKLHLSSVAIVMHGANFLKCGVSQGGSCPLASDGVSVMVLALAVQFIWAGKAHEEQHSVLHRVSSAANFPEPPGLFRASTPSPSPSPIALSPGTAPSLCKELFPQ